MKLNVNGQEHDLAGIDPQHAVAVGASRQTQSDRHQIRVRACAVRGLHGPYQRSGSPVVLGVRDGTPTGKKIVTIEAISGRVADAVRSAWQRLNVVQCGYCQSGQIMTAISLLSSIRKPTDADIDAAMDGNICRCGTYIRVRKAIHEAARSLA